jgi:hypothetical protein
MIDLHTHSYRWMCRVQLLSLSYISHQDVELLQKTKGGEKIK